MKKKKNGSPALVTKEYLKKEIIKLATKNDLEITEKSLRIDIKLLLLNLERRLEQRITQTRDILLTTFDPLLKELEQRREDREIATYQTEQIRNQLNNHEQRIKKLETQETI